MSKLTYDKFREARGGYARIINIICAACKTHQFRYQKDGPGTLKRIYVDRIVDKVTTNKKLELICSKCKHVLGTYFIYKKENRPSYRLYQDSVIKRIVKI